MRSTKKSSDRSPNSSPETADRIQQAAIREFAEKGFTKPTIRGIASAAGVSPGLVIHHFGSKEGLRSACDDYVFTAITEAKAANARYSTMAMEIVFADPVMRTNIDYLMKSLLDPSEHGQRYFEHYIDLVEGYLADGFAGYTFRQSTDRRGQAATIAALALAPMMLAGRIQTALGTTDVQDTLTRLAPHLLDLYVNGVLDSIPDVEADTDPNGDDQS
ncbi:TetR family transcriptional regulator [Brevibacterium sanguinis]|uniref:TetR family transcriptional regulator n=2 Tax=Brevibacterium TaxID=1696 RepID=A0A366IL99_9MICO|nr:MULTISPECIES: TetR/AcrR family transcriptional regulator [Brevibacterium]RBP66963.1 TetR family transcriptional regulator [Brevibacterium sanguinis]RBP73488.1 TetR family transcriptional regulator [Brevibacterium celere]